MNTARLCAMHKHCSGVDTYAHMLYYLHNTSCSKHVQVAVIPKVEVGISAAKPCSLALSLMHATNPQLQ